MSRGDPNNKPRVAQQPTLFGGVDVLCLYGEGGRIRSNILHARDSAEAQRLVASSRQLEHATAVELVDQVLELPTLPQVRPRRRARARLRHPPPQRPPRSAVVVPALSRVLLRPGRAEFGSCAG